MVKLTKRQQQFCDAYAKYGGNWSLICKELNIKPQSYQNFMRQDAVREYLACSMERARDSIVAALPHITETLLHMYNCSNVDDRVKVEIAKQFLDRAGLVRDSNVNVNVNINTSISTRARELLAQRQTVTIETTATPVAERVSDNPRQVSSIIHPPIPDTQTPSTPAPAIAGTGESNEENAGTVRV